MLISVKIEYQHCTRLYNCVSTILFVYNNNKDNNDNFSQSI